MLVHRFIALLLFVAAVSLAHAGAPKPNVTLDFVKSKFTGITFAVPKAGGLRPVKNDVEGIHFKGSVRVAGTYIYGFDSDYVSDAGDPKEPDLYFVPDAASRALLPYWYERGEIQGFHFSNPKAFLRAAIAPSAAANVKQRKTKSLTGKLTIWIDDYVATGECDSAVYTARFLRIEHAPDAIARNAYADPISCS